MPLAENPVPLMNAIDERHRLGEAVRVVLTQLNLPVFSKCGVCVCVCVCVFFFFFFFLIAFTTLGGSAHLQGAESRPHQGTVATGLFECVCT